MWTEYKRTLTTFLIALIVLGATFGYYSYAKPITPIAVYSYTEIITIKNNGTRPISFGGISAEAFLNFSWQRSMLIHVNRAHNLSYDMDGNPFLIIDGPSELASNETYTVTITWTIESFLREIPEMKVEKSGNLSDISSSFVNYTKEVSPWKNPPDVRLDTDYWNTTEFYNLTLREVALKLKGEKENVLEILLNDVSWISSRIAYFSDDPTYPIETARNRKGDCDDQSNLLITLLRVQGIPAFLMMGQVYLPGEIYENLNGTAMNGHLFFEANHTIGHAWAMVYVPPWGWLPADPTVVTGHPEFSIYSITEAIVLYPRVLVFQNVTGVYEQEGADYIDSLREETEMAEEEDVYFWLSMEMKQHSIPEYVKILQSPLLVLFLETMAFAALTVAMIIYDRSKTRLSPSHLRNIYCIYCGARVPFDASYCGHCGQRAQKS